MDIKEKMAQSELVSDILGVLANPTRLLIVCLLIEKEMCAGDLLAELDGTKSNLSQHLKLMLLNDLLQRRKDGNKVFYSIKDKNLKKVIRCLTNCYCK